MRNLLPLDIAGSDEEGNEDTYTTNSAMTIATVNRRNKVLTVHQALQEGPNEECSGITDLGHPE